MQHRVFIASVFVWLLCAVAAVRCKELPNLALSKENSRNKIIDSLKNVLEKAEGEPRIKVLRGLGWEYRKFDLFLSYQYSLQSVELARTLKSVELPTSLNVLGISYRNFSNYPKALECFMEALRSAISLANWREEGYAYNNMGDIYRLQGNYDWASENVQQAVKIFEEHQFQSGLGYCFTRLGEIAMAQQKYDQAFVFQTRAYEIRRALGDSTQMYIALTTLGMIHRSKKQFQQSLECQAQVLAYMRRTNATSDIAATLGRIADTEFDMGAKEKAIQTAEEGLRYAYQSRTKIDIQSISETLWRSYEALGQYKKAFEYQSLFLSTRDSILSEETIMQTAALTVKYEVQRKQDEIEAIERSNLIIRWALVFGLCLAAVMIGILMNRYRLKQRSNDEIMRQQSILTEQSKEIELVNTQLQEEKVLLEEERQLTQRLLVNVLPESIASRLMAGEKLIAERFENVTVLFSDVVGFSALAKKTPPEELVALLDTVFSAFDVIAEEYSLEKIKTIGDCYMLVGGLPEPSPDHCERTAAAALAMLRSLNEVKTILDIPLEMRIGIHTGEVVAGVIGKKKFSYDLWGDTVNTASRMESHGETGKIHISEEVLEKIKDKGKLVDSEEYDKTSNSDISHKKNSHEKYMFRFYSRGKIDIKGQGQMNTYFLEEAL